MANKQFELFNIPNPCIGVCQSNSKGYCVGCLRSRDERFNWHLKTPQEQRKIIQLLARRKARIAQQLRANKHALDEAQTSASASPQGSLFDQQDLTDKPDYKNKGSK